MIACVYEAFWSDYGESGNYPPIPAQPSRTTLR